MAKISMLVPDEALAEIDEWSNGNRSSFMIAAALERARKIRRERMDDEIAESCARNAELDLEVFRDWECTIGDGID